MREIKFRMIYEGKIIKSSGWAGDLQSNTEGIIELTEEDGVKYEQYTGLKDKNGVEIYESDLIDFRHSGDHADTTGVVVFRDGHFCLKHVVEEVFYSFHRRQVVTGNIHDKN